MALLKFSWDGWRRVGGLILLGTLVILSALAQDRSSSPRLRATESEIKSAYIYNFALFTRWPARAFESPEAPLIIGVLGDGPFDQDLDKLVAVKKAGSRDLRLVREFAGGEPPECHILFIAGSERKRLKEILAAVKGKPVLTVSDLEPFCQLGGCVRFTRDEKSLGLFFNPKAAADQGLRISPELLAIGKIRETKPNADQR
jgi:hypothetical protein